MNTGETIALTIWTFVMNMVTSKISVMNVKNRFSSTKLKLFKICEFAKVFQRYLPPTCSYRERESGETCCPLLGTRLGLSPSALSVRPPGSGASGCWRVITKTGPALRGCLSLVIPEHLKHRKLGLHDLTERVRSCIFG